MPGCLLLPDPWAAYPAPAPSDRQLLSKIPCKCNHLVGSPENQKD